MTERDRNIAKARAAEERGFNWLALTGHQYRVFRIADGKMATSGLSFEDAEQKLA